jgi:hypothetical protein
MEEEIMEQLTKEFILNDWSEFSGIIKDIRSKYGYHRTDLKGNQLIDINTVLFRGQRNATWPLTTTLERNTKKDFSLERYLLYANQCANEI